MKTGRILFNGLKRRDRGAGEGLRDEQRLALQASGNASKFVENSLKFEARRVHEIQRVDAKN